MALVEFICLHSPSNGHSQIILFGQCAKFVEQCRSGKYDPVTVEVISLITFKLLPATLEYQ